MGTQRPLILKENKVYQKTNIPRRVLEEFFAQNIVELKFTRRIKPPWYKKDRETGHLSYQRRMLCTSNWRYIKSPRVRYLYNWKKPKSRRGKAWYRKRKLVIVWDIMMNDWRMVSLDKYKIVGYTSIKSLERQDEWTEFYRAHINKLPENKKKHYSDL
jgi:hypothetical protein